jgi:hypothetical protein
MNRRILAVVSLVVAAGGFRGTNVAVNGPGDDGKVLVSTSGSDQAPPIDVLVGRNGIEPLPTAIPGQPTPVYPIGTRVPAPTPRPS